MESIGLGQFNLVQVNSRVGEGGEHTRGAGRGSTTFKTAAKWNSPAVPAVQGPTAAGDAVGSYTLSTDTTCGTRAHRPRAYLDSATSHHDSLRSESIAAGLQPMSESESVHSPGPGSESRPSPYTAFLTLQRTNKSKL